MKSLIKDIKTVLKARKFLKKQAALKDEGRKLVTQVKDATEALDSFVNVVKNTYYRLQEEVK